MFDVETVFADELDRLAPAERPVLAWEDVLQRAGEPQRRRRSVQLASLAVLIIAIVPTLAFSAGARNLLGLQGDRPILAEARLLVSTPIGNGYYAHSWRAPSTSDGTCAFFTVDHQPAAARPVDQGGGGGGGCGSLGSVGEASIQQPLILDYNIQRRLKTGNPANWVPPVINGALDPSLHAIRVVVAWHGGSRELTLRNGHFLGGGPYLYMPTFGKFPFVVIAYNSNGREVARKKIESPSLLLLRGGWKQYTREYHAWERTHPHP